MRKPCTGFFLYVVAFLLIAGTLTGLGFLFSLAGNERKAAVDKFNSASSLWSSGGYAAFLALNVSLGPQDGTPPQLSRLKTVMSPDSFPDTEGGSLKADSPLLVCATLLGV